MGDEPQLRQTLGLGTSPILVGELGVRVAAPQQQRLARARCRSGGVPTPQPRTGVGEQALEPGDIEPVVGQLQHVAGRLGHHLGSSGRSVDDLADPRHVAPQGRGRGRCRVAGEHRIGESVDGDHLVAVDQQHRQEPPLPRPADAQLIPVLGDAEPTQRVELDHPPTPLDDVTSWRHSARSPWQSCGSASYLAST